MLVFVHFEFRLIIMRVVIFSSNYSNEWQNSVFHQALFINQHWDDLLKI